MKIAKQIAAIVVLTGLVTPLIAAENDSKAFGQFQEIVEAIDQRSFEMFRKALDETDLANRVHAYYPIENNIQQTFRSNFWGIVETGFQGILPPAGSKSKAKLVQFSFQDGLGKAGIRFQLPNYKFGFFAFDLRHDRRGRLKIVDWFDAGSGQMFSAQIRQELFSVMPNKESTRRLLSLENPSDLELFQITEILKAIGGNQAPRFFEIYDQFEEAVKREPVIARQAPRMALMVEDFDRFLQTLEVYSKVFADQANMALELSDYYMVVHDYEKSFESLRRFQQNFSVKEGALPAKLSALALVIGNSQDAEKFAVQATVDEPSLELGWWSLLRARAGANDYQGALDALTYLEDNFDQRLDESKLRRDKFKAFTQLAASQEFKDWRVSRN